jgi:flagellar motor switch protein FliG
MAEAAGDDVAILLLRGLPAEIADTILGRLDPAVADRLRARVKTPGVEMPANEMDVALAQFFDLLRIAERPVPAAGEYSPVAAPKPETPADPLDEMKALPPEQLARALAGEQPGAVTLILSCLEPAKAGQIMKRLPVEMRAEVAVRMTKLGARNPVLLKQLATAVAGKARKLGDVPAELTQDELIGNLADMLRAVPRAERLPVVRKIEATDAELAAKVIDKLYRIDDLLRIPDRQIQVLLGRLDVKTIALALKGTDPAVLTKVTGNMSSRSKSALEEESELLSGVAVGRIKEAQAKVIGLIRKGEEDGDIVMEE